MAVKAKDVYRGRKKTGANGWLIAAIVLVLILLVIGAFYLLRHLTVYDSEGNATIVFPWTDEESVPADSKKYDEAFSEEVESRLDETRSSIAAETAGAETETDSETKSSDETTDDVQDSTATTAQSELETSESTNYDEKKPSQQEEVSSDASGETQNTEEIATDSE